VGMAKGLAERCELVSLEPHRIVLRIPPGNDTYLVKTAQDKLKAALRKLLGDELQVAITVGTGSGTSPAEVAARKREEEQARAVAAMEQDPFVRELVDMGARVSSIKPGQ